MGQQIYKGRIVDLRVERVTLPNGTAVDLELMHHPGASAVVAVDDGGRVVLIRQYRHAAGDYIWELPAGILDAPDEPPESCAARELAEEAGVEARELTALGTPPDGASCVNTISIRQLWVGILDAQSSQVFCDGTTPVAPGDDTLKIPSSDVILVCEKKLASIVAKLLKCQAKCHLSRAKGKLADDTAEESCENDVCVTAKYNAATAKLVGCPGCLNFATLASNTLANGDNNAGFVYCAP